MIDFLVSIKMMTCNHTTFIAHAIEGILQQDTNFPFELCLSGRTVQLTRCGRLFLTNKERSHIFQVITSDNNVSMKNNSCHTVKDCRGKNIGFCEGNDCSSHPFKLHKKADYMESHQNAEWCIPAMIYIMLEP